MNQLINIPCSARSNLAAPCRQRIHTVSYIHPHARIASHGHMIRGASTAVACVANMQVCTSGYVHPGLEDWVAPSASETTSCTHARRYPKTNTWLIVSLFECALAKFPCFLLLQLAFVLAYRCWPVVRYGRWNVRTENESMHWFSFHFFHVGVQGEGMVVYTLSLRVGLDLKEP